MLKHFLVDKSSPVLFTRSHSLLFAACDRLSPFECMQVIEMTSVSNY